MQYRRFGKTGQQMPCVSFGCMRSMYDWSDKPLSIVPKKSQEKLKRILKYSLACGINHIETASGYGSSERQLGELLHDYQRNDYILQTKVPPSGDTAEFTNRIHESLNRLQVDRIDLLAIHGINDHRNLWYSCRKNGCLRAARTLQDAGKIGHIGFSGHGSTEVISAAIEHEEDGGFDYVNLHYYYIFTANLKAIAAARERDMGVYIISPTDKGGQLQSPPQKLKKLCQPLSPMLFNDLFCLTTPGVTSISVGAAEPEHFDEHLKVIPLLKDGHQGLMEKIDSRLRYQMKTQTGHERPDHFFNTLPDWQQTPGHINIPLILWLADLAQGWDLSQYASDRYNKLGHDMPWVPGNNGSLAANYSFDKILNKTAMDNDEIINRLINAHTLLH